MSFVRWSKKKLRTNLFVALRLVNQIFEAGSSVSGDFRGTLLGVNVGDDIELDGFEEGGHVREMVAALGEVSSQISGTTTTEGIAQVLQNIETE